MTHKELSDMIQGDVVGGNSAIAGFFREKIKPALLASGMFLRERDSDIDDSTTITGGMKDVHEFLDVISGDVYQFPDYFMEEFGGEDSLIRMVFTDTGLTSFRPDVFFIVEEGNSLTVMHYHTPSDVPPLLVHDDRLNAKRIQAFLLSDKTARSVTERITTFMALSSL